MSSSLTVAVIGAGVAGLIAARELQQNGHRVTVYEKSDQLGGTWTYDPRVESDPLSLDPNREIIHNSLYSSLRTNHPRQIMRFSDYPFTKTYADPRNFPGHEEVLKFLNDFAEHFQLTELIRFNTDVVRVEQLVSSRNDKWIVESRMGELSREEIFEAVVVCNGHHTEPQVADFPQTFWYQELPKSLTFFKLQSYNINAIYNYELCYTCKEGSVRGFLYTTEGTKVRTPSSDSL